MPFWKASQHSGVDPARIRYYHRYTHSIPLWMQEVFIITMTTAKVSFIQIHLFRQNKGVPLLWDSYPLTLSPNSNTCDRYFVFHEKHDSIFRDFYFSVSNCSRGSHIIKIWFPGENWFPWGERHHEESRISDGALHPSKMYCSGVTLRLSLL